MVARLRLAAALLAVLLCGGSALEAPALAAAAESGNSASSRGAAAETSAPSDGARNETEPRAASDDAPHEIAPRGPSDDAGGAAEAARQAFTEGLEASRAERWEDAERSFRRSAALVRRQSTLYNWALSLYMTRRFRECIGVLEDALRANSGAGDGKYAEYEATLMKRVRAEVSVVRLVVSPENAGARVDGETTEERGAERSLRVLPGTHAIDVSAPDYAPRHLSLTTIGGVDFAGSVVLERARTTASENGVARERTSSSAPFFVTTAPWIAIGVGGALLAAGAVTGVLALAAENDLEQKCPTTKGCDPSLRGEQERTLALGRATDVLLASGGVFVVGGIAWRLIVPVPRPVGSGHAMVLGAAGSF